MGHLSPVRYIIRHNVALASLSWSCTICVYIITVAVCLGPVIYIQKRNAEMEVQKRRNGARHEIITDFSKQIYHRQVCTVLHVGT